MAVKNYLLGEERREGEEMARVRRGELVLTNSALHSREYLYESVRILGGNTGNSIA